MLILKSYAKINLFLEIKRKREDGYHEIDTLFQELDLHDTLSFNENSSLDKNAIILKANIEGLDDKNNLVMKAVNKLLPYLPKNRKGLAIALEKNIPTGAGLGGGSSNAAATLTGLNQFYKLNLSREKLVELGSQLGADVPFFIHGGIARGQGIGEKLTYYNQLFFPLYFVIIYPNIHASTKEAYADLILHGNKDKPKLDELIKALANKDFNTINNLLYNQFEESQFKKYPVLKAIKNRLLAVGALSALMSGSGSSMFGIFESEELAKKATLDFRDSNYQVFYAKSIKKD